MSYGYFGSYGASAPTMSHSTTTQTGAEQRAAGAAESTTSSKKGCKRFKKGSAKRRRCLVKKGKLSPLISLPSSVSTLPQMQTQLKAQAKLRARIKALKAAKKAQIKKQRAYLKRQKKLRRVPRTASTQGYYPSAPVAASSSAIYPYNTDYTSTSTPVTTAAYTAEVASAVSAYDETTPSYIDSYEAAALAAEGIEPEAAVLPGEEEFEGYDEEEEDSNLLLYAGLAAAAGGVYWFFLRKK